MKNATKQAEEAVQPKARLTEEQLRALCQKLIESDPSDKSDALILLFWNIAHQESPTGSCDLAAKLIDYLYIETRDFERRSSEYAAALQTRYQQAETGGVQ